MLIQEIAQFTDRWSPWLEVMEEVWSQAYSHLSSADIERSFQVMGWEIGDDSVSIMVLT